MKQGKAYAGRWGPWLLSSVGAARPAHVNQLCLISSCVFLRCAIRPPARWPLHSPSSLHGVISSSPHSDHTSSFTSSGKPSLPHSLGPFTFLHVVLSLWSLVCLFVFLSALHHNLLTCVYQCDSLINNEHPHLTVSFRKAGPKGLCLFSFLLSTQHRAWHVIHAQ